MWDDAIETLRINNSDLNDNQIILDNIENIDAEYLSQRNINYENLDVLFGGIVCKGFSLAGIRNPYDPRNYLYLQHNSNIYLFLFYLSYGSESGCII